jgi:hypothetical protein
MSFRKALGVFVVGALTLCCSTYSTADDYCPSIETVSEAGVAYRLDGTCRKVENHLPSELVLSDWHLSVWTGEKYLPIVATVSDYSWLGGSEIELQFLTLSNEVRVTIPVGMGDNS